MFNIFFIKLIKSKISKKQLENLKFSNYKSYFYLELYIFSYAVYKN
jgi:hypothetical protein